MTLFNIKLVAIISISGLLFGCGGGGGSTTTQDEGFAISEMTNAIIAENLDHADHTTWNLDNFNVVDDIDGNDKAEAVLNTMVDEMVQKNIAADLAEQL